MSPKVWESAPPPTHIWERSPKKSVFLCLPLPRNILSTQGKSNDRAPTSLRVWALLSGQLDMGRKGWGARPKQRTRSSRKLGRWQNWYKTRYKWPLTNLLWLPLHIQFSPLNVHPPPPYPKSQTQAPSPVFLPFSHHFPFWYLLPPSDISLQTQLLSQFSHLTSGGNLLKNQVPSDYD